MKVVILAGGMGSRLSEETEIRPKPMVEIGGKPILWHIMKQYSHYGFNDFVLCLGYKGDYIKRWFTEQLKYANDMTVDFTTGQIVNHGSSVGNWRVTLADTGENAETGGRLLAIRNYVDDTFLMTYGDGVSDVNINDSVEFHKAHGKLATVTAVHPLGRFGHMDIAGQNVTAFNEKPQMEAGWINGGFFVLDPQIFDYIPGNVDWARAPLEKLASNGELVAYKHEGFWQCMDTMRDKLYLQGLWDNDQANWKVWS